MRVKPRSGQLAPSLRCYETNRRASIEDVVDGDPVAACVQGIMATRSAWTGNATDLLRAGADLTDDGIWRRNAGWPKNPRALAGRLSRAQTFLRAVGIDIAFSREGRAGHRVIRMRTIRENTVGTVSSVGKVGSQSAAGQPRRGPPRLRAQKWTRGSGAGSDRSRLPPSGRRCRRC